jgi:hypothetical protein
MMTPCRARNVISLILLAGLIAQRDARPVELLMHAFGQSLVHQHDDKFTLRTITISSTAHIGGAP